MGAGLVLRWNSVTMRDGRVDVLGGTENIVTIDTDRHAEVSGKVQREPLQRRLFAPRRAQNLLAGCIFDGLACQKCFCVTLDKSNRTPATPDKERM